MSEGRFTNLENRMEGIEKKLDRLLNLLQDDEFGRPGMNTRLQMIEKKQGYTDNQLNRIKWTAGIIAAIISILAAAISVTL